MQKLVAVIKKIAVEMILNDEMKEKIVAKLNDKINSIMVEKFSTLSIKRDDGRKLFV